MMRAGHVRPIVDTTKRSHMFQCARRAALANCDQPSRRLNWDDPAHAQCQNHLTMRASP